MSDKLSAVEWFRFWRYPEYHEMIGEGSLGACRMRREGASWQAIAERHHLKTAGAALRSVTRTVRKVLAVQLACPPDVFNALPVFKSDPVDGVAAPPTGNGPRGPPSL